MGDVVDLQADSELPRRAVSKNVVGEVEDVVVDRASCLDILPYTHRLGKQEIQFIDLSGPERSELCSKAATVVHLSINSPDGKQSSL
jgi:hypothetical protein